MRQAIHGWPRSAVGPKKPGALESADRGVDQERISVGVAVGQGAPCSAQRGLRFQGGTLGATGGETYKAPTSARRVESPQEKEREENRPESRSLNSSCSFGQASFSPPKSLVE